MFQKTSVLNSGNKGFFGSAITAILGRLLPASKKRLILFASLSARISKDKAKFNISTLHKLNEIMVLSNRDDALLLPVQLSKVIWSGDDGNVVLYPTPDNQMSEDDVVNKIMSEIPDWLKYSNMKGIKEDLLRLLHHQEVIVA